MMFSVQALVGRSGVRIAAAVPLRIAQRKAAFRFSVPFRQIAEKIDSRLSILVPLFRAPLCHFALASGPRHFDSVSNPLMGRNAFGTAIDRDAHWFGTNNPATR